MAQDACLVVICLLFFYVHTTLVVRDGVITSVPFAIEQGLLAGMFLTRRRSTATSTRPLDWAVASVGGWLPFALQAQHGGANPLTVGGTALQCVGLAGTIICFCYLGKSFGIVAANRGLKKHGPYGIVRHPIYLSHTVTMTGLLIANYHPLNLAIVALVSICQLLRIRAEERILTATADYAAYRKAVRWRLLPGLY
ncbi:MAG: methyltransferase family protein [Tepidiformaceae bacterium]